MSVTNSEIHTDIGELRAEIRNIKKELDDQGEKIDQLVSLKDQLQGGRRAVLFALSLAAALGGAVSWALTHLSWK